jgi:tetratricopeptide (TPR) repeat protein
MKNCVASLVVSIAVTFCTLGYRCTAQNETRTIRQRDVRQDHRNRATEYIEQAKQTEPVGGHAHTDLLLRASIELKRAGDAEHSLGLLTDVERTADAAGDRAQAARLTAQSLAALGRSREAEAAWLRVLQAWDTAADDDRHAGFAATYASSCVQLSASLDDAGKVDEALDITLRLVGEDRHRFDRAFVGTAISNSATLYRRLHRSNEAVHALDDLFEFDPEFGRDDGWGVIQRLNRVELLAPTIGADETAARLTHLWRDETLWNTDHVLRIGRRLFTQYRSAGRVRDAMLVAAEIVDLIDQRQSAWTRNADGAIDRIKTARLESERNEWLKMTTSAHLSELPHLAMQSIDRLLKSETDPGSISSLQAQ